MFLGGGETEIPYQIIGIDTVRSRIVGSTKTSLTTYLVTAELFVVSRLLASC